MINDRRAPTGRRFVIRHRWRVGAHRYPHSSWGAAGLFLAVAAVPASWAALLTGAGLPHGASFPIRLPGVHATHLPYVTRAPGAGHVERAPGPSGSPTGLTPNAGASPSAGAEPSTSASPSERPKGKPNKPPKTPKLSPSSSLPVPLPTPFCIDPTRHRGEK